MRGRKPKPTALKLIEGNKGKRPLNQNEPKLPAGELLPPSFLNLSLDERAIWNWVVPKLLKMNCFQEIDPLMIGQLCKETASYFQIDREFKATGGKAVLAIQGPRGGKRIITNPYFRARRQALESVKSIGSEYGLTISSRCRISVPGSEEDDFIKFMRRK